MFSQSLEWAQWAGPVTGIAATLLVLFTGYVLMNGQRRRSAPPASRTAPTRSRKQWRSSVPHTGPLPTDLEYQIELTWK
jgi:hypothetical protein